MTTMFVLTKRENTLLDLRQNSFRTTTIFVAISVWVMTLVSSAFLGGSPTIRVLIFWIAIEALCISAYRIAHRNPKAAAALLIIGLWIGNLLGALSFGTIFFLYLFSVIVTVSAILWSQYANFTVALLSTAVIALMFPVFRWDILPPMLMVWVTLLSNSVVHRALYVALDIAWTHQDYAIEKMTEAREHRRELMQTTKALSEAKADLERANSQLRYAQLAAEEARRMKAQFAATVSHELRTPINLIVGFSEMIINSPQSYPDPLPSAYLLDINTIYRNGRHLQSLINDVLDMSQIEASQMAVVREECDPRQILLDAANLMHDEIVHRGLAFNLQIPDAIPMTRLDRLRIRQVVINLLSNAIRFTDKGSITLKATVDQHQLRICVMDTGIGIPRKDLARVFEEFHQLDGSLARRHGGSGLGLSLSKQFAELHGGTLIAESDGIPGKGSTFTLVVPLTADPLFWETRRVTPSIVGQGRSFIVYDEDPAITQLFERYAHKHQAVCANTLDEALRLVQTIEPSALIMDRQQAQRIPEAELARLRELTPIIKCPMPSGKRDIQQQGAVDYLVKPVTFEMLQSALQRFTMPIKSVLIIDDEKDIVRLFTRMFQSMSQPYRVRKAYSGLEGLRMMERARPDLVILDLLLPEIDGFTVLRQMKTSPTLCNVPVLVVSAYGGPDTLSVAVDGKLDVSKPKGFQPVELVQCVEALISVLRPAIVPKS
jgi:signal transduction histidine kinase/CheY-like chemotaxis protein